MSRTTPPLSQTIRPGRILLILALLSLSSLGIIGVHTAHASGNATNVVANGDFEQGASPCVTHPEQQCPVGWDFETCEGVPSATIGVDAGQWTRGSSSASVSTGPISPVGCFPGNYTGRAVGFSQFRQELTGLGYNFTKLTNSSLAFSFWFRLQPLNTNGMAGFNVRVFGAEASAELDYVFNPDPSVGQFQNSTNTHSLLFYGYQPGQWYHFSRNLMADWMTPMGTANTPLSLNWNFTLLQFQGFASKQGTIDRSESYWLDDVRLYEGAGQIPTEKFEATWDFADANNNNVNNIINWTLTDSAGQTVTYTQGQTTLASGPYFVHAYYRAYGPNNLILSQQIPLNQSTIIHAPIYATTIIPGGYVIMSSPVTSIDLNNPSPTRSTITLQGTTGATYTMITDVPSKPLLIQANGVDMNQGYDWTFDATLSLVRASFVMQSGGENITIFFQPPMKIPTITLVDLTGTPLGSNVPFRIIDSQGKTVPYLPGNALPTGTFYLEAYYAGFTIYRNNLSNIGPPPVTLEIISLDRSTSSYLALNSTATSISPTQYTSSQIAFSINGTGPYLIVMNVPSRPLFIEKDGIRTPDWVYNETNHAISIESSSDGSFLVVLNQPSEISTILPYIIGGIAAGLVAVAIAWYLLGRRRRTGLPPLDSTAK